MSTRRGIKRKATTNVNYQLYLDESSSPSSSELGVYENHAFQDDSLPVESSKPVTRPKKFTQSRNLRSDSSAYDSICCRLCLSHFGRRESFTSAEGQRRHVLIHLRQAVDILSMDEKSMPPLDRRVIGKCFTKILESTPEPELELEPETDPESDPDPDPEPELHPVEKVPTFGVTARIGKCKPLFSPIGDSGETVVIIEDDVDTNDLLAPLDPAWMDLEPADPIYGVYDEKPQSSRSAQAKRIRQPVRLSDQWATDQCYQNKVNAVEKLKAIYNDPLKRTNFELGPGSIWPCFIAYGYRYRLARVYNNGKCELRCVSGSCKGKAVIRPDEPFPYHLQPSDEHSHEPMVGHITCDYVNQE